VIGGGLFGLALIGKAFVGIGAKPEPAQDAPLLARHSGIVSGHAMVNGSGGAILSRCVQKGALPWRAMHLSTIAGPRKRRPRVAARSPYLTRKSRV